MARNPIEPKKQAQSAAEPIAVSHAGFKYESATVDIASRPQIAIWRPLSAV
jgi:hypothetical protein